MSASAAPSDEMIVCEICKGKTHTIKIHLEKSHPGTSLADYKAQYPSAPLLSAFAENQIKEATAKKAGSGKIEMATSAGSAKVVSIAGGSVGSATIEKEPLDVLFGMKGNKDALSTKGAAIPVSVVRNADMPEYIPIATDEYVYDIDELKNVIMGLELNIPIYVHGHKGCGKSQLFEQVAGRTGRPFIRVQHTANTEESHVVGQWTVRAGATHFELGLLPLAMKHGMMYLADEYDFAMPSVLSVYQAVLEGKPLVIKEADPANRIIHPHPNFRFVATGNTNGSGDETGMYQGTLIQNAANYDRFGIVLHKKYMSRASESEIIQRSTKMQKPDADKLAEFAALVREAYDGGKINDVISPRSLKYAAITGIKRGSFRKGLEMAFINKLNKVDREIVDGLAQRIFV